MQYCFSMFLVLTRQYIFEDFCVYIYRFLSCNPFTLLRYHRNSGFINGLRSVLTSWQSVQNQYYFFIKYFLRPVKSRSGVLFGGDFKPQVKSLQSIHSYSVRYYFLERALLAWIIWEIHLLVLIYGHDVLPLPWLFKQRFIYSFQRQNCGGKNVITSNSLDLPCSGLLPSWLQNPDRLGCSQEPAASSGSPLVTGTPAPGSSSSGTSPRRVSRKLDQKWSSWVLNQCPCKAAT